jgi:hypothetical protein
MREVQTMEGSNGWNYMDEIQALASDPSLESDRRAFIDAVSGIVNRGCPALSCPAGAVGGAAERASNFEKAWAILGMA